MARGLKMHYSRDKQSNALYKIEDVEPDNHGDFVCENCGVGIKYTRAHTRVASNEEVDAYFSLKPGINHRGNCKYNITVAITKIVDYSQSVEEGDPVISSEVDGTYVYRLNFLEKAIKQITPFADRKKSDNNKNAVKSEVKIGTNYVLTEKQIASCFRSAMGVAKIKSMIEHQEDNSVFKKKIGIMYRMQKIKWSDFYFETKDYQNLYETYYKYPVAIKVIVSADKVYSDNNKYSVRCVGYRIEEEKTTIALYSIFLHFNDKNLANQMKSGASYIVLGKIWCTVKEKGEEVKLIYKTIHVNILNKNQVEDI